MTDLNHFDPNREILVFDHIEGEVRRENRDWMASRYPAEVVHLRGALAMRNAEIDDLREKRQEDLDDLLALKDTIRQLRDALCRIADGVEPPAHARSVVTCLDAWMSEKRA